MTGISRILTEPASFVVEDMMPEAILKCAGTGVGFGVCRCRYTTSGMETVSGQGCCSRRCENA